MCKEHVRNHLELPAFTGHPLVGPLSDLAERKCAQHEDEVLRYYCNSSRRYICNICALDSKHLRMDSEKSSVLQRQLTVSRIQFIYYYRICELLKVGHLFVYLMFFMW